MLFRSLDLDGVITDGTVTVTEDGKESKRFWAFYPTQYADERNTQYFIIGLFSFGLLFPFFILGLIRLLYDNNIYSILFIGLILFYSLAHSIIHGTIRYILPIEPYIILLGSYGLFIANQKLLKFRKND